MSQAPSFPIPPRLDPASSPRWLLPLPLRAWFLEVSLHTRAPRHRRSPHSGHPARGSVFSARLRRAGARWPAAGRLGRVGGSSSGSTCNAGRCQSPQPVLQCSTTQEELFLFFRSQLSGLQRGEGGMMHFFPHVFHFFPTKIAFTQTPLSFSPSQ